MNKGPIISGIICGIAGLALGGGGVYIWFSKLSDARKNEEYLMYKEDLEEARETIKKLQSEKITIGEAAKEKLMSTNEYKESVDTVEDSIIDLDEDVTDEEDDDLAIDAEELPPNDIRFIGPNDYEDDDEYEKETIKYYIRDNILTQDDEIVEFDEFKTLCGSEALNSFGKYGASSNEVYVRNEHFCTDYKIKKYNISYERYINGLNK